MKVIKHGKEYKDPVKTRKGRCASCKCQVEVTPKEIKHVSDSRDGDYDYVYCPECGFMIYF